MVEWTGVAKGLDGRKGNDEYRNKEKRRIKDDLTEVSS